MSEPRDRSQRRRIADSRARRLVDDALAALTSSHADATAGFRAAENLFQAGEGVWAGLTDALRHKDSPARIYAAWVLCAAHARNAEVIGDSDAALQAERVIVAVLRSGSDADRLWACSLLVNGTLSTAIEPCLYALLPHAD